MGESNETKFARIELTLKNFKESNDTEFKGLNKRFDDTDTKIDKNLVTQDQLRLVIQEFKPYKQLVLWLLGIVATETIALLFYLIRTVISLGK